jgi:hypothetical protein
MTMQQVTAQGGADGMINLDQLLILENILAGGISPAANRDWLLEHTSISHDGAGTLKIEIAAADPEDIEALFGTNGQ